LNVHVLVGDTIDHHHHDGHRQACQQPGDDHPWPFLADLLARELKKEGRRGLPGQVARHHHHRPIAKALAEIEALEGAEGPAHGEQHRHQDHSDPRKPVGRGRLHFAKRQLQGFAVHVGGAPAAKFTLPQ